MGRGASRGLRRVEVLGAMVLVPLLAACSSEADEHASTGTDVRRAEDAWRDPWLAPTDLRVPTSAYGSDGYVSRFVGDRSYVAAHAPSAAVEQEVRAALADGWALVGATCAKRKVVAQLSRGADLDDAVLGAVIGTASRRGTSEVQVAGQVPHHADGSWPLLDADPVDPGATCLAGGSGETPLVELPYDPTAGAGEPGRDDFEGWQRDELSDDEQALLDDLATDPWVVATLPDPEQSLTTVGELRTGDSDRFGVQASGELPGRARDPRAAVAAVVDTMTGWEATWAACSPGPRGMVDVRLRRVTDAGVATVRLLHDATSSGVRWQLNTPLPEGPDPSWVAEAPALDGSRCLGGAPLADGVTVEGEPVSLPTHLQPVP